jgi:hypothetical protein
VISTLAVAFAPVLVKYLTGGLIYGTTRNILLPASVTTLFSHFQWLLCLISDEIVKRHLLSRDFNSACFFKIKKVNHLSYFCLYFIISI